MSRLYFYAMELLHKDLTDRVLKAFYEVYNELGYGFLECVYQNALFLELTKRGFFVEAQKRIQVYYKEREVGLLLNFGPKPTFRRNVLTNDRKKLTSF